MTLFSSSASPYLSCSPVNREQHGSGPARPARAYSMGLYCFQPKGSAASLTRRPCKVSHCLLKQRQRLRSCQRPLPQLTPAHQRSRLHSPGHGRQSHGLLICSSGSPYCWCEVVKVQWRCALHTSSIQLFSWQGHIAQSGVILPGEKLPALKPTLSRFRRWRGCRL